MADYAISNVPRRVVYAASGTGPYAFTFEILNQTDIAVYKASTLLTLTTDYTVTINANGTGSVTLVTSAGTSNITIVGAKNIQRTTDFTTGGDLFANTLNDELDNQTIFIQQVAETAERGLKAPVVDPTDINMTLPAKASRVGTVLAFNATTGNPEAGPSIGSVTTVAAQSANINTVATNIASVNTVAGNITNVNTVAGVSSNVTTVASNIANVNAVGADLLEGTSEINTVAVDIANVNTVGTNIASVNTVAGEIGAGQDVTVVAANLSGTNTIGTVATNIANVNATGTNIANVNAVGADLLEPVSEINTVATDITNVNTVGTNIASVNTVSGISGAVSTVSGIAANVTTVAGVSANVTTVAGISSNVTTVAGIAANVTAVAGISSDVTIAAANVADISNFADVYQGAKATDPTLRNDGSALQSGDLYFNTTDDVMKVREAGAWLAAYASLSGALIAVNNLSDVTSASTARTNLGLGTIATQAASSVAITGGSINGTTVGATTASTGRFSTLEATGVTTVSAGTVSAPAITTTGDTNTGIFFPAADTIAFAEGGVESVRIDSTGNFGIGTSTPATRLHVAGSSASQITTRISNANSTVGGRLSFVQGSPAAELGYISQTYTDFGGGAAWTTRIGSQGNISFATNGIDGSGETEQMRIAQAGNVGIGTSSPASKLEVSGSGTLELARFATTTDNTPSIGIYSNGSIRARLRASTAETALLSQGATPLLLGTDNTERMRIASNGYVGIGTSSPSSHLVVNSATATQFDLLTNGTRYFTAYTDATQVIMGSIQNTIFSFRQNDTERMQLDTSGNLRFNSGYGSVAVAYGCRAWVNFNGTGTVAIRGSGNVSSISDNGVGNYSVNFTTAMPDANYSANVTPLATGSNLFSASLAANVSTSNFNFITSNSSSATTDTTTLCCSVFR